MMRWMTEKKAQITQRWLRMRAVLFCCAAMLCAGIPCGGVTAYAAETEHVYDWAELLDSARVQELESEAAALEEEMNMSVVLVTTADAEGLTTQEYGEEFYESGDFGRGEDWSGTLFLIDMDNREFQITESGTMNRFITDERREMILDAVQEYMVAGDYAGAMNEFLAQTGQYYRKGIPGNQYNYNAQTGEISRYHSIRWYEFLLALGVSAFCGIGACLTVIRQYKMKDEQKQASNYQLAYRADSKFAYSNRNDVLTNKFVTHTVVAKSNSGGHGGGSVGSPGRSTTHTSQGGRSFGGGGRKF